MTVRNPFRVRRHGERWIVRHIDLPDVHFGIYDNRRDARACARAHRRGWRLRDLRGLSA